MAKVTAEVKGDNLILTLPFDKAGKDSGSGKSLVHSTTNGGEKTSVKVGDKDLIVSVNAYTSKKA